MLEASTPFWVFQDTSKASTCPESPALEIGEGTDYRPNKGLAQWKPNISEPKKADGYKYNF